MSHVHGTLPRAPLIAAAALAVASLALVAFVRLTGVGVAHYPDAVAVDVRELRFEDRADGGIRVVDAVNGAEVDVLTGPNGFVRGTLRGFARDRKRQGVGPEVPLRLIRRADGRLTLEDPATGRRVDLESFGPTNAAAFAHLMSRKAS